MDVHRALRQAVQTGVVVLGYRQTKNAVESGKAKLVVLSSNAPEDLSSKILSSASSSKVPVYRFSGLNKDLGPACGKPFPVSFLGVVDPGESDVLLLSRGA